MVKRSRDDGEGHRIPDPMIHFSENPLWPWEFGNVMLQESSDGMENLKPVKREANGKVDNIQMLLSALILYDAAETQINK
jgi:phage terminase large subunit-like protein